MTREYNHYFKSCPFAEIDVYRVLHLFEVTDPCLQHAVKKLLCAGGRGAKDQAKDIGEAIDTLKRWQEMRQEEAGAEPMPEGDRVRGLTPDERLDQGMFERQVRWYMHLGRHDNGEYVFESVREAWAKWQAGLILVQA